MHVYWNAPITAILLLRGKGPENGTRSCVLLYEWQCLRHTDVDAYDATQFHGRPQHCEYVCGHHRVDEIWNVSKIAPGWPDLYNQLHYYNKCTCKMKYLNNGLEWRNAYVHNYFLGREAEIITAFHNTPRPWSSRMNPQSTWNSSRSLGDRFPMCSFWYPAKGTVGVGVGSPGHETTVHVVTAAVTKPMLIYSAFWRKCNLPGEMIYRV